MTVRLGHSKGNECEENPREIRAEKIQHYGEVASFAGRGVLFVGTMGIAAISAIAIIIAGLLFILGIVFQAFSAF
ncbi:membrane protein [Streptomyces phage MeganTheeKilla]|uniref:Membrane protein n=1 Tax=Streptomyces phage MeganTheeKilla TaxID=2801897 RepID=A0A7U0GBZ0_9CAUD|nr:membrane protein [Streptomyces phage MeganTheeKilla]QQV92606.1 membrane protein [Streptomyces phage MeganTheeKilla]